MRLQARSCFQSHKELFIICPCSNQPTSVPFFFSAVPSSLLANFLLVALLNTFWPGYFQGQIFLSFTSIASAEVVFPSRFVGRGLLVCTGDRGDWVELTVNQQLALFLLRCSVKGTVLNQLKRTPNWFQWAVHVEIWTLEIPALQVLAV